mgnify:CR=1 FL=1
MADSDAAPRGAEAAPGGAEAEAPAAAEDESKAMAFYQAAMGLAQQSTGPLTWNAWQRRMNELAQEGHSEYLQEMRAAGRWERYLPQI